jgi:hypothetical protein
MGTENEGFPPDPGAELDLGLPRRERRMFRYVVPVDDQAHAFALTGDPVAVATMIDLDQVEFWAEHDEAAGKTDRAFRVFGTGQPLPPGARWTGTCARLAGLVWHLYEVTP